MIVLPITFTGGVYIVPMHAAIYIDIVPLAAHGLHGEYGLGSHVLLHEFGRMYVVTIRYYAYPLARML